MNNVSVQVEADVIASDDEEILDILLSRQMEYIGDDDQNEIFMCNVAKQLTNLIYVL